MSDHWESWSSLPWLQQAGGVGTTVQLCDRLLNGVAHSPTVAEYLAALLPDIASEFSVQWVAVVERWPKRGVRVDHWGLDAEAEAAATKKQADFRIAAMMLQNLSGIRNL